MAEKRVKSVSWWEPRWSYVPQVRAVTKESFRVRSVVRIVVVSAIAVTAIALVAQKWLPGLQFNWPLAFGKSLVFTFVVMLALYVMSVAIPPIVSVNRKWIQIQCGEQVRRYKLDDVLHLHLIVRDEKISLWICTTERSHHVGVSRKAKLANLPALLGDKLRVHDRRTQVRPTETVKEISA